MVTRLDLTYDREVTAVRAKVAGYAARLWGGLAAYRDADAERLVATLVPRVEAAQLRIGQLTDAYISRVAAAELGSPIRRGVVADTSTLALRGVEPQIVYNRPFVTAYTKLSEGKTLTAAVSAGGARLASIVNTSMQLASTHAARTAGDRAGVELWMRTLTGRENCGLCVIASTQRYYRGNLMPIHGGCDCIPKPFRGERGKQVIDSALLERMHAAVEAEFGGTDRGARFIDGQGTYNDFADLIVTHAHGELGPVLGWRHQHFSTGDDVA